jgi:hypothetical protein
VRCQEEGVPSGGGCGVELAGRMSTASRAAGGWCGAVIRRGEGVATAGWCGRGRFWGAKPVVGVGGWVGGGERRATQTGARPGGQNRVRGVVRSHVGWMARV